MKLDNKFLHNYQKLRNKNYFPSTLDINQLDIAASKIQHWWKKCKLTTNTAIINDCLYKDKIKIETYLYENDLKQLNLAASKIQKWWKKYRAALRQTPKQVIKTNLITKINVIEIVISRKKKLSN